MNNIWFCLNVYQEEQLLPECLDSIRKYVPEAKIVAVDGSYRLFSDAAKIEAACAIQEQNAVLADAYLSFSSGKSTDRTLEILKDYKVDKIIETDVPWENEYIKRSQYFIGEKSDIYFVLDADERVVADKPFGYKEIELDMAGHDHACINLRRDDQGNPYHILRVHKHFDGMHYFGAHHALWCNDQLVNRYDYEEKVWIKSCTILHRWTHRGNTNRIRHLVKGAYYIKLGESENAFRGKYNI